MNKFKSSLLSLSLILALSVSSPVYSLEIPKGGVFDSRVKSVIYNPEQVVQIIGHYGYSTHIQFSPLETVENIAMGDSEAWEYAPTGNHIFLKPKGKRAGTNMTVITNKRVYNFDLHARQKTTQKYAISEKMYFQINFTYPDEVARKQKVEEEATKLKEQLNSEDYVVPLNWNYWGKGTKEIMPIKVFDDGRFTYLTFNQNIEMPALYMLDSKDKESLINTSINPKAPDTIVLQRVNERMILRKGDWIVLLVNKSYDPTNPRFYKHDTTIETVERTIKEVK